jgi:hypothetical protein
VADESARPDETAPTEDGSGADPVSDIRALLNEIPGAWGRIEAGIADTRAGRILCADEL